MPNRSPPPHSESEFSWDPVIHLESDSTRRGAPLCVSFWMQGLAWLLSVSQCPLVSHCTGSEEVCPERCWGRGRQRGSSVISYFGAGPALFSSFDFPSLPPLPSLPCIIPCLFFSPILTVLILSHDSDLQNKSSHTWLQHTTILHPVYGHIPIYYGYLLNLKPSKGLWPLGKEGGNRVC